MNIKQILAVLILILLFTVTVMAQGSEVEVLKGLFNTENSKVEGFFDQAFLEQVPAEKIIAILNNYKAKLGQLIEANGDSGSYTLVFEKGTAPAKVVLNTNNKIEGLWFGSWSIDKDTPDEILSEFKALAGSVSVSVIKNNKDSIVTFNSDKKMAVGSSFKLYVLKTIYDAVEKGNISWNSIIELNSADKSLPSGILQDWPAGTPLTIKTLTNLMISLSDNTATDILVDVAGRENIEGHVSRENIPFLKTNELFKLKYAADSVIQEKYINSDPDTKREILNNIGNVSIKEDMISSSPVLIEELEWFFTTEELCDIIYELRGTEEIKINPGLAVKEDWNMIGYKGGSEPGVLQYTHLLQKEAGQDIYAVSVTVNNPDRDVDKNKITELTGRLISLVSKGII